MSGATPGRSDALVSLGATDDLAHKQVFPASYGLVSGDGLDTPITGLARDEWDDARFAARARGRIAAHGTVDEVVLARLHDVHGDNADADIGMGVWVKQPGDRTAGEDMELLLAEPPANFKPPCQRLLGDAMRGVAAGSGPAEADTQIGEDGPSIDPTQGL